MKKIITSLAIFLTITSYGQKSIPVGTALPLGNVKMKDISGKQVSIQDAMKANGVLVMFSCNTCPYVIKNQGRTKELADYAKANQIGTILLNSNEGSRDGVDSYNEMQHYAKDQGYDFYYAVDAASRLADAFGATRTPEVFLFDAKGILQYKGAIDDNPTDPKNVKRVHSHQAIQEMAGGKPVSIKESRSLGCAIKRNGK